MSRLGRVGNRFMSRYSIVGGKDFLGQILAPPDTSRVSNMLTARRYLRVFPPSPVAIGSIVSVDGEQFLVAEHGKGFHTVPIYIHFKLFKVDEVVSWKRPTLVAHAVTGIKTKTGVSTLGTAYVSVATKTDLEDDVVRVQTHRRLLVTNVAVVVDDLLGDEIITKVDRLLGLYLCETKDR